MYKKIMLATDGSEVANHALEQAIKLAQQLQSELLVVHVVDEIIVSLNIRFPHVEELQKSLITAGQEILAEAEERAAKQGLNLETKLILLESVGKKISDKLIEEVHAAMVDLIVLGTQGRRGLERFLLGSVAESLVRKAPVPVLLVNKKV